MREIQTDLTERLDSLPWRSFHTKFVLALGITWVLDAFEVVIVSAVLKPMAKSLSLTPTQSSLMTSAFLFGAIAGSLIFGYLADRFGRKSVFIITLLLYSGGTFLTGLSWNFESAFLFRFLSGAGLGGEFAAIQSAIDEFIPARHRGKVDGTITALWNLGSTLASMSAFLLLKTLQEDTAWRVAYLFGGVLAILIIYIRLYVPESPRWLISRGKLDKANKILESIEKGLDLKPEAKPRNVVIFEGNALDATRIILVKYRWRFLFSAAMSFTILTTYYGMITLLPVILSEVYGLSSFEIPKVLLFGSVGGLIGGLIVASLVDKVGRIPLGLIISALSAILSLGFILGFKLELWFFIYALVAFSFASVGYVVATEIYPSFLRAYAIGLLSVIGRISGAFAPVFMVQVSSSDYRFGIFTLSAFWLTGFVAFVIWAIKGRETKGLSLEEMQ
ncbi:MAG: MFS transporter [Aquificaceae bacterium]